MKSGCFVLFIYLFFVSCWFGNLVRLIQCDFDPNKSWKGEIVHVIGLIGPAAAVTVWFDDK